ncbi:MAG: TAXI family TRAP transporter solute-binding subunit [Desulfovibrio sp.]|jgi:TRAP transporter TAXI family solute receptor|nr:TAXI family TRAP transporter solute-binding subunit [Desulfovibrio sp.]
MKLKIGFLALAFSLLCLTSGALAAERLSLATGGTAGTYFPIGGAIANAVSKGGVVQATAETSNASVANINLVGKGEIETAIVQNDVTFWAYNGQNMFENKPVKNLRAVLALYPEHVHLVVSKASKIAKLSDLRGKRVSVGAPGSGVEANVKAILQAADMTYKDLGEAGRMDFASTANRFKDEQVDAAFLTTGYPSPAIMDIAATKEITLVSMDRAFLDKLHKIHPYFVPDKIPAGTYRGVDKDAATPAVMAIIVAHDKVSEKVIYEFLKGIFDNLSDVQASHAKAKEISLDKALSGLTVPLHPGAVKYYKEKGVKLP